MGDPPTGAAQPSWRRVAVSAVLLIVLGLQAAAGSGALFYGARLHRSVTWPFLDYGMFREAHFIGESEVTWSAELTLASSGRRVVTPFDASHFTSVEPLELMRAYRERDDAAVQAWCDAAGREAGEAVTALDWYETSYLLERDGFRLVGRRKLGSFLVPVIP